MLPTGVSPPVNIFGISHFTIYTHQWQSTGFIHREAPSSASLPKGTILLPIFESRDLSFSKR
ncbi:MAG: hypothetical protein V7K14_06180 [Nostoc sp.]